MVEAALSGELHGLSAQQEQRVADHALQLLRRDAAAEDIGRDDPACVAARARRVAEAAESRL